MSALSFHDINIDGYSIAYESTTQSIEVTRVFKYFNRNKEYCKKCRNAAIYLKQKYPAAYHSFIIPNRKGTPRTFCDVQSGLDGILYKVRTHPGLIHPSVEKINIFREKLLKGIRAVDGTDIPDTRLDNLEREVKLLRQHVEYLLSIVPDKPIEIRSDEITEKRIIITGNPAADSTHNYTVNIYECSSNTDPAPIESESVLDDIFTCSMDNIYATLDKLVTLGTILNLSDLSFDIENADSNKISTVMSIFSLMMKGSI